MLRRDFAKTFVSCALLTLLGMSSQPAAAQSAPSSLSLHAEHRPAISNLLPPLRSSFTPVRILRTDVPPQLQTGEPGLFTVQANIESATLPLHALWDFGDGTSSRGLHARHSYREPGTYVVVFRLWNEGSEAKDSVRVSVMPARRIEETVRQALRLSESGSFGNPDAAAEARRP